LSAPSTRITSRCDCVPTLYFSLEFHPTGQWRGQRVLYNQYTNLFIFQSAPYVVIDRRPGRSACSGLQIGKRKGEPDDGEGRLADSKGIGDCSRLLRRKGIRGFLRRRVKETETVVECYPATD
jgi:hypothetical protein